MLSELKKGDDVVTAGGHHRQDLGHQGQRADAAAAGRRARARAPQRGHRPVHAGRRRRRRSPRRSPKPRPPIGPGERQRAHGKSLVVEGSLYGFVTVLAVLYLVPDAGSRGEAAGVHQEALPEEDSARARPSGRPAPRLRGQRRQGGLRQGRPPVVGHRGPPAQGQGGQRRQRRAEATGTRRHHPHLQEPGRRRPSSTTSSCGSTASRWTWSSATPATGVVRLRLDPDQIDELRDYALRQGIETIRNRVDKLGVAEPTIIKKGTDIIVELPGLKPGRLRAHQEHHRPHRAARVQDRRRRPGVHEEGRRRCAERDEGDARRPHRRRHRGLDREGLGQAARGRLPALEEPRRAREVLRRR